MLYEWLDGGLITIAEYGADHSQEDVTETFSHLFQANVLVEILAQARRFGIELKHIELNRIEFVNSQLGPTVRMR